ncbi:MAG: DMT family transporter [Oscillospiraceae bacterium]|nr:DMT family transporter [Oscillospiraceae bacterium]
MKKSSLRNSALLLLTALIWGVAFVAQKDGMEYVEPFTYNGLRSLLGGVVLLAAIPLIDKLRSRHGPVETGSRRNILLGGALCGVVLFVASNLQQFGIALQDADTNVGKAGFITACYCAIVPVMGLFLKKKSPLLVWLGVAVAVVGFFFLCLMDGLAAGQGLGLGLSDFLLLLCAVAFSVHILVIDHFSPLADGVRISCVQFLVCGGLCLPLMFIFESPSWENIAACWLPITYAGVMSCGVAYTLQIVGQRGVHPAVASLILSLESVFSVLAGYVLMPGSALSHWELIGCALVMAAVVMVQLAPTGRETAEELTIGERGT